MDTATINWHAVEIMVPMLTVILIFSFVIWRMERARRLEDKLRERTINEIYNAMDAMDFYGGVPPVAVERFMSYLKVPDPTFDAKRIIRQELDNQQSGPIGGAKDDRPFKNVVNP